MKQLKMVWKPVACEMPQLPEGWTMRTFNGTQEDIDAWGACCRNGLMGLKDDTNTVFEGCMTSRNDFSPDALFFLQWQGKPVATITCLLEEDTKVGDVHMVGSLPECRGRGVGKLLMGVAMANLWQRGAKIAYLTTDDFRVPAIQSYLTAGFMPVDYDVEMEQRWAAIAGFLGRTNVPFVTEDGTLIKLLNPTD